MAAPSSSPESLSASADLPLAVGPAIRMASGLLTPLELARRPMKSTEPPMLHRPRPPTKPTALLFVHAEAPVPLIQPFRALRPAPGRAAEILAPPYDVLSSTEARERAK